jgi:hypothetical protein
VARRATAAGWEPAAEAATAELPRESLDHESNLGHRNVRQRSCGYSDPTGDTAVAHVMLGRSRPIIRAVNRRVLEHLAGYAERNGFMALGAVR